MGIVMGHQYRLNKNPLESILFQMDSCFYSTFRRFGGFTGNIGVQLGNTYNKASLLEGK